MKDAQDRLYSQYVLFWIGVFELGVSWHYVGLFKPFNKGRDISEGHVGLFGVISSSLIIYDNWRKVKL